MVRKNFWPLGLTFFSVLVLDLLTKKYVLTHYPLYYSREVIPGFFNLVHIQNRGVAFGFLSGQNSFWRDALLTLLPLAAIVGILIYLLITPPRQKGLLLALGGVLGGALGNLIDRFRFKAVVDFLDFYWGKVHWPAFNVADSAITLGVLYLIYRFWREA
jgi:signal peptidase II